MLSASFAYTLPSCLSVFYPIFMSRFVFAAPYMVLPANVNAHE